MIASIPTGTNFRPLAHTTTKKLAPELAAASALRLANKKLTIGLKGLWGQGMGRYGSSTIADVTIRPEWPALSNPWLLGT